MIQRIHHIGIAFGSLKERVKLFSDLFGFRPVETHMDSDGAFKSHILRINEAALEFIEPVGSGGPFKNFSRNGTVVSTTSRSKWTTLTRKQRHSEERASA